MKIEVKKGQLQISFGVIFSIIIIIATLAIAGYVIVKFLSTSDNVECKLFYSDLQKKIDEAWSQDGGSSYVFSGSASSESEQVCFGYINQTFAEQDRVAHEKIDEYSSKSVNLFFYPIASCGDSSFSYNLKHIKTDKFFCVDVQNGKASVKIAKGTFDALVKLCLKDENCNVNNGGGSSTAPAPITSLVGTSNETESSVNIPSAKNYTLYSICQKAEEDDLCLGLNFAFTNIYKQKCCSEHMRCCD